MLVLFTALATGALAGLMSLPHCVAMCGPYAGFACAVGGPEHASQRALRFLTGRVVAYALLGALVAGTGGVATSWLPPEWASIALAASLALGMISLAWRLVRPAAPVKTSLVTLRVPSPRTSALTAREVPDAPARARTEPRLAARIATSATGLGALMGLFPCGALYAALLVAAGTGSALTGGATLIGFALTSGLALGLSGWVARVSSAMDLHTRRVLGLALIVGAVILVVRPLTSDEGAAPTCHTPGAR